MMVMALDPGTRRIGVAVSDPRASFARPLEPIEVRGDGGHLRAIAAAAAERSVERIVVGLPLRLDGTEGPAAKAARELAAAVRRATGRPVELFDERLTTVQAERGLIGRGMRREKRRERIDSAAAALLLEAWLEARRGERGDGEEETTDEHR
ncbi:MAG: Holliday junction resolvase RuvX [Deltaproteobacteria bacterium]|nr:Holliday junction resolvase RuvX [Deltaproteobacteria bacterium]